MKYIKTFEKLITLDLEQKELNLLMSDALSNNNLTVIRSLLENGYDPDSKDYGNFLIQRAADKPNIEMVKLFIEFDANLNTINNKGYSIIMEILNDSLDNESTLIASALRLQKYFETIILLIKSGEEIDEKFITLLNSLRKRRNIGGTAENLFNRIVTECPKEYERYEINIQRNKFNL